MGIPMRQTYLIRKRLPDRKKSFEESIPVPLERLFLHYITLFFRINYVWCNVIVYINNSFVKNLLGTAGAIPGGQLWA